MPAARRSALRVFAPLPGCPSNYLSIRAVPGSAASIRLSLAAPEAAAVTIAPPRPLGAIVSARRGISAASGRWTVRESRNESCVLRERRALLCLFGDSRLLRSNASRRCSSRKCASLRWLSANRLRFLRAPGLQACRKNCGTRVAPEHCKYEGRSLRLCYFINYFKRLTDVPASSTSSVEQPNISRTQCIRDSHTSILYYCSCKKIRLYLFKTIVNTLDISRNALLKEANHIVQ